MTLKKIQIVLHGPAHVNGASKLNSRNKPYQQFIVNSANEVMFPPLSVCWLVCLFVITNLGGRKRYDSEKNPLKFGVDPDQREDPGIKFL